MPFELPAGLDMARPSPACDVHGGNVCMGRLSDKTGESDSVNRKFFSCYVCLIDTIYIREFLDGILWDFD